MTATQRQAAPAHAKLHHIRIELAHSRPESSDSQGDGYDFVAPLDADGHLDVACWKDQRLSCFVHKLGGGVIVERGLLVHSPGGAGGASWQFDYALGEGDEETGFRFDTHRFMTGEYVSVRDAEGELRTYRVVTVKPA